MPDTWACNEQPIQMSARGPHSSSINVLDEQKNRVQQCINSVMFDHVLGFTTHIT